MTFARHCVEAIASARFSIGTVLKSWVFTVFWVIGISIWINAFDGVISSTEIQIATWIARALSVVMVGSNLLMTFVWLFRRG
ncbi:hypothetical protein LCGC14_2822350 [marine sediment metagenome]|uniref:Uncharacterized protein n=1 Tax=marine sediment metagenome TaxID=412755 RepID=A0A0F9B7U2_9ZZZZ